MVEQETVFDKEKLKNKRVFKDTPLHAFASKWSRRFTLGLGCAHVSFIVLGYYSNVSEEFLTAGPKQIDAKAIELGIYEMRARRTSLGFESAKEEFFNTSLYDFYEGACYYMGEFRKFCTKSLITSEEAKVDPKATVSKPTT